MRLTVTLCSRHRDRFSHVCCLGKATDFGIWSKQYTIPVVYFWHFDIAKLRIKDLQPLCTIEGHITWSRKHFNSLQNLSFVRIFSDYYEENFILSRYFFFFNHGSSCRRKETQGSTGALGKDKWEWEMDCRALCSANGSCVFPLEWLATLLLTIVPLHCNYLQERDSYWEWGRQKSRQRGSEYRLTDGGSVVRPFSPEEEFSTRLLKGPINLIV